MKTTFLLLVGLLVGIIALAQEQSLPYVDARMLYQIDVPTDFLP